jgi:TPR repeat protein
LAKWRTGSAIFGDALTWFRRASDKGHWRSLFWVGKLYWHGRGVALDKKHATTLFQRAAKKKVREAQRALRFLSRISGRSNKPLQPTSGVAVPKLTEKHGAARGRAARR